MKHTITLAHAANTIPIYELPLPLGLTLACCALAVLVSFLVAAFFRHEGTARERKVTGARVADIAIRASRAIAVTALLGALLIGLVRVSSGLGTAGFSLMPLLFWVGLVIGGVLLCSLVEGTWGMLDPWATLEAWSRQGEPEGPTWVAPWWIGPAFMYLFFWFELVSGVGFSESWVVVAIVFYTAASLTIRSKLGPRWAQVDPLSILFGLAGRAAPLRLGPDGLYYRGPLAGLVDGHIMSKSLYGALFVVLGATTLDNARETVVWNNATARFGLGTQSSWIVESAGMVVFVLLFFAPFITAVAAAHRWMGRGATVGELARRLSWSVVPIGIAYVLAHNASLLMVGGPQLVRQLADPFGLGWNILGLRDFLQSFVPSPTLVWLPEIVLIVGGHVLAVFAAHGIALRMSESRRAAVWSQIPLTILMSLYTVATLGLLAQPLL